MTKITVLLLVSIIFSLKIFSESKEHNFDYLVPKVKEKSFMMPQGKTIPFDWKVAELLPSDAGVKFDFNNRWDSRKNKFWFRITSATDIREEFVLELTLAKSGRIIGEIDIRYAHYMQPFELEISGKVLKKIVREGTIIRIKKGTAPFWFFIPDEANDVIPKAFLPHILIADEQRDPLEWKNTLCSFTSLSTFGWMEGCVLDGLHTIASKDSSVKKTVEQHLDMYFSNNTLTYEAYNNNRVNKINTVESVLPFAFLSKYHPEHNMIQEMINYCTEHADKSGIVADGYGDNRMLKTEECYTISYPLAILARDMNRRDLEKIAIVNLQARADLLSEDGTIYQRAMQSGPKIFANWARGVGWYLLGMSKTLSVLPENEETIKLKTILRKDAEFVMRHQQDDGLWYCFIHQQETGVETSGSAVIAAALAHAYSHGFLCESAKAAAKKCYNGLQPYLTPDGFLTGSVQVNKGGESLQRNGFRVISPYTLGFLGVLGVSLGVF